MNALGLILLAGAVLTACTPQLDNEKKAEFLQSLVPNSGTMTPTYEVPPGPELPDDLTHEASFIALGTVTTTETFEHQNTSFTLVTFSDLHTLKGLSGKTKVVFAFQREPDVGVPAFHLNDRGVGIVRSDQVHAVPAPAGECVSLIARFSSQLSSQTSSLLYPCPCSWVSLSASGWQKKA